MARASSATGTTMFFHQIGDLIAELTRPVLGVRAGGEVVERRDRPVLVHRGQILGQVRQVGVVEQHHRSVRRHEGAARLVVRAPDLHVGRIGRVAGIDLIEQEQRRIVALFQLLAKAREAIAAEKAREAIAADRIEIDRRVAELHGPMLPGQIGEHAIGLHEGPPRNGFHWRSFTPLCLSGVSRIRPILVFPAHRMPRPRISGIPGSQRSRKPRPISSSSSQVKVASPV
jgi:hypothetical protein